MVSEIWCHRNKVIFKGGVMDHFEIFSFAQLKTWSWVTSKVPSACFSFFRLVSCSPGMSLLDLDCLLVISWWVVVARVVLVWICFRF